MNMQLKKSDRDAALIDLTRCFAASDRQQAVSRRSQALLAAAGMDAPARRWFVATVAPGMDKAVAEALVFAGVGFWMPTVMVKPSRRGGIGKRDRPAYAKLAFPGYVFVNIAANDDAWAGLSSVKGVVGLLGSSGRPLPVADDNVALLRAYLTNDKAAVDIVTDAVKALDSVIVRDGPFVSFPGTVREVDERGFAIVDILIFGRETGVQLDLVQLKKL